MTTLSCERNTLVRVAAAFTSGGVATDPTVVTFAIRTPVDGAITTYTYPTNGQIVRDGAGLYHVDWLATQLGLHDTVFTGSGSGTAVQVACRQKFYVRDSPF